MQDQDVKRWIFIYLLTYFKVDHRIGKEGICGESTGKVRNRSCLSIFIIIIIIPG
jgi:hypothetical protein